MPSPRSARHSWPAILTLSSTIRTRMRATLSREVSGRSTDGEGQVKARATGAPGRRGERPVSLLLSLELMVRRGVAGLVGVPAGAIVVGGRLRAGLLGPVGLLGP